MSISRIWDVGVPPRVAFLVKEAMWGKLQA